MKKSLHSLQSRRSTTGFTLVEMLIVIAIIAILASVTAIAAGKAINAAKRSKSNATAAQIEAAILNYDTEYGTYPIPSNLAGSDVVLATSANEADLMVALCGNINASSPAAPTATLTVSNTRQIVYLTPKRSDVDAAGVIFNPFTSKPSYGYFSIAMDGDYSGILGDGNVAAQPPDFSSATQGTACPPGGKQITKGVAVWACCDPKYAAVAGGGGNSPQFWVHTY